MYLQLIIDGKIRETWYLDEKVAMERPHWMNFDHYTKRNKKIVDDQILRMKQTFWQDIACCRTWEIMLSVESKIGSMHNIHD